METNKGTEPVSTSSPVFSITLFKQEISHSFKEKKGGATAVRSPWMQTPFPPLFALKSFSSSCTSANESVICFIVHKPCLRGHCWISSYPFTPFTLQRMDLVRVFQGGLRWNRARASARTHTLCSLPEWKRGSQKQSANTHKRGATPRLEHTHSFCCCCCYECPFLAGGPRTYYPREDWGAAEVFGTCLNCQSHTAARQLLRPPASLVMHRADTKATTGAASSREGNGVSHARGTKPALSRSPFPRPTFSHTRAPYKASQRRQCFWQQRPTERRGRSYVCPPIRLLQSWFLITHESGTAEIKRLAVWGRAREPALRLPCAHTYPHPLHSVMCTFHTRTISRTHRLWMQTRGRRKGAEEPEAKGAKKASLLSRASLETAAAAAAAS